VPSPEVWAIRRGCHLKITGDTPTSHVLGTWALGAATHAEDQQDVI